MENTVRIIYTYYGSWPWYFNYFVDSCRHNALFEFLIVTDLPIDIDLPANVKIIRLSQQELSRLIARKIAIDVDITDAYKLCDFKPVYGKIFEDYLKDFTFWGHGDIDVIFGNIGSFVDDNILNANDVLCFRHDFVSGYFTLYRNNDVLNSLFKESKDYIKVLSSPEHFCFDETCFAWEPFTDGRHYTEIKTEVESMTHVIKRMHEKKVIRAYFDFHVIEGCPGKIKWIDGSLYYKNSYEAILYHLIKFKTVANPKLNKHTIGKNFKITPTRIVSI